MLNQYAMDIPTLTVNLCLSHLIQFLVECFSRSIGMPSRKNGPPSIWDTQGFPGNVLQIQQRLLQHLIRRSRIHGPLIYQNKFTHHMRRRVRTKHQFRIRDASPDRQPKISVISHKKRFFKELVEQTNNDCRSQIFISTNSPLQQHLFVGR